jgi:hypothetical protein
MSYHIIRFFQNAYPSEIIKEGLTLEEAQAHCRDPETSSRTATSDEALALTAERGDWFDGYDED